MELCRKQYTSCDESNVVAQITFTPGVGLRVSSMKPDLDNGQSDGKSAEAKRNTQSSTPTGDYSPSTSYPALGRRKKNFAWIPKETKQQLIADTESAMKTLISLLKDSEVDNFAENKRSDIQASVFSLCRLTQAISHTICAADEGKEIQKNSHFPVGDLLPTKSPSIRPAPLPPLDNSSTAAFVKARVIKLKGLDISYEPSELVDKFARKMKKAIRDEKVLYEIRTTVKSLQHGRDPSLAPYDMRPIVVQARDSYCVIDPSDFCRSTEFLISKLKQLVGDAHYDKPTQFDAEYYQWTLERAEERRRAEDAPKPKVLLAKNKLLEKAQALKIKAQQAHSPLFSPDEN
jgi:hypothetical protein